MGEIFFCSPHLARGYLDDESLTKQGNFMANPFTEQSGNRLYRTGDLGRYRPDGNVESLGRADDQVKIRGFRIELGEIQAVLGFHPAIREAAILAREDKPGDKQLVAYLVLNEGQQARADDLNAYLRDKLPDYMVPSAFVFLDKVRSLPMANSTAALFPPLILHATRRRLNLLCRKHHFKRL